MANERIPSPLPGVFRLERFVRELSLPLWAGPGFDAAAGRFRESLAVDGRPVAGTPLRLMVQARQIATYARAALAGWFPPGAALAETAFRSMIARYRSPDGEAGWVFSLDEEGLVVDATRDLYAHAFVLYACAWMHRLTAEPDMLATARATVAGIDAVFGAQGPGYASRRPEKAAIREQNPHMHLLEALLALAETSKDDEYLARASRIVALFRATLADSASGAVQESFDVQWQPRTDDNDIPVEPGHQFEWAWLLREYSRLSGARIDKSVDRLISHGCRHGIDAATGAVREVVTLAGKPLSTGSRIWPHTEALRALVREATHGRASDRSVQEKIVDRTLDLHCPLHLKGGWHDRVDEAGRPMGNAMPASTLYHLAGSAIDIVGMLKGPPG